MVDRNDQIEGPFFIENDLLFRGMITKGATVRSGVTLDLKGMIAGDLDVEHGARALIYGMVPGTVRNHGGYVQVFGVVGATVDLSPEARTIIEPKAVISGLNR